MTDSRTTPPHAVHERRGLKRQESEERQLLHGAPGDIPLVHTFYDTYVLWNTILEKFPKAQRYTLGEACSRFILTSLEIVLSAACMKDSPEKFSRLHDVSGKIDATKLLVRLCKDCKCMTEDHYFKMESLLIKSGKMLGGWIKSKSSFITEEASTDASSS